MRLAGQPGRVLLDSAGGGELSRWSFATARPLWTLEARGRQLAVRRGGAETTWRGAGDPLATLEQMTRELGGAHRVPAGAPPVPVAIGWLGYDLGRMTVCGLPERAADRSRGQPPDLWFGFFGAVYRFDEVTLRGEVVGCDAAARAQLERIVAEGPAIPGAMPVLAPLAPDDAGDAAYRRGFARVAEYLAAGDVYQVNLARRLRADVLEPGDPMALHLRAVHRAPAAYSALIEAGSVAGAVLSASPERFLYRAPGSDRVETRPIKGTRRRAPWPTEDARRAAELRACPKERAEHLMIVDLERNDLGRVARTGSVAVDALAQVVSLPTVHHLVSTVSCRVAPDLGPAELLRATFPGGSITGAPKRRAMQIIDQLEPFRRGVYCGALGYLGQGGALDLAIAIRTAVLSPERLELCVGGGLVSDSTLERELEETEEKAAAWRATLR